MRMFCESPEGVSYGSCRQILAAVKNHRLETVVFLFVKKHTVVMRS